MPRPDRPPSAAGPVYRIDLAERQARRFRVRLTIATPAAEQTVSLPVWIPGSYLVREFARHLSGLRARQGRQTRPVQALDKCSWRIACDPAQPLVLDYVVHASDPSVRTAWLDALRGFFNGTSVCLRVHGQEQRPHQLQLPAPDGADDWRVACALTPRRVDARGFGRWHAADYAELIDAPVELGPFWHGQFDLRGTRFELAVAGAPAAFDGARLLADTRRIVQTVLDFWHGPDGAPPHGRYVFMLNAVDDHYGGLEHRASTALICGRRDLPRRGVATASDGYVTLLGLIAHEYFHTWNVKRLRPAELATPDYGRENYTRLLWFFEGFTSYYDDLLLRRAGLIDDATYLKLLTQTVNQVLQTPGRAVQSVADASFDAWIKYYRPDEHTPNLTVSYYTKGALVALCFDLTLRREGRGTLDALMRALWLRCGAGPMSEDDFAQALQQLAGRSFAPEIAAWVHGTGELPLQSLLETQRVRVLHEPAAWAQALGLRVTEGAGTLVIKLVLDGGPAMAAGMAAGDEWLGIETAAPARPATTPGAVTPCGWRLKRLDDLPLYAGEQRQLTALVVRDERLLRLPLRLPSQPRTWRLLPPEAPGGSPPWLQG